MENWENLGSPLEVLLLWYIGGSFGNKAVGLRGEMIEHGGHSVSPSRSPP